MVVTRCPALTLIAAHDRRRVIGRDGGGIPWHLPRDVQHFRRYTAGKHLLLGRRTYEEMLGWFQPTHFPWVLTRQESFLANPGQVVGSVTEALERTGATGAEELVVCGGASVYAACLSLADKLELTLVDAEMPGSVFFPEYQSDGTWQVVAQRSFPADEENAFAMKIVTFVRVIR